MNTTQKLLTLLLALLLPATALALPPYDGYDVYDFEVDGIYYVIAGDVVGVSCKRHEYGNYLSDYCGDVVIPSSVTYQGKTYPVTFIDDFAFNYCEGLTSVTIPESITIIKAAFNGCTGLTRVIIKDLAAWCNIKLVSGLSPLVYAHHLYLNDVEVTDLTIPDGITEIPDALFYSCTGLTSVTIPNTVTSIGDQTFEECSGLTSVSVGNSVTEIGTYAFSGCTSLKSINIPNSVTNIGLKAFMGCTSLKRMDLPNSLTTISGGTFNGCTSLLSIDIPYTVTTIGVGAFFGCTSLTGIDIPNTVTEIGVDAFMNCSGMMSVTIGSAVTTIGHDAFFNDAAIETITCKAVTPPSWDDKNVFPTNVYNHTPLHVPIGSERAYMSNQCWGQFLNIIGDVEVTIPGDVNGDGNVNISDANSVIEIIVSGGNGHDRVDGDGNVIGDMNGDRSVNISDLNVIIHTILSN